MNQLIDTFFNLSVMRAVPAADRQGMGVTVVLALAVVVTGLVLGFVLAVLRSLRIKPLNALIIVFVDVFRAVPPLVIIILFYFALPTVGVRLSVVRLDVAGAVAGAGGVCRGDRLGRHPVGAARPMGSGALHRAGRDADACAGWCCRRRCG